MFCKNCGKEIANEAIMCVHCGVPTNAVKAEAIGMIGMIISYLFAFFTPVIGLIIGFVMKSNPVNKENGEKVINLSLIMIGLNLLLFLFIIFIGANS